MDMYHPNRHRYEEEKQKAGYKLRDAIKKGVIERPENCSQCGKECFPDAHHFDYDLPLDVFWLCRKCHLKIHREGFESHDETRWRAARGLSPT
jgi:ribosomal protein S27AE